MQGRRMQDTRGGETHKGLKAGFLRRFQGSSLDWGLLNPGAKDPGYFPTRFQRLREPPRGAAKETQDARCRIKRAPERRRSSG